ncbi:SMODS-associated NUDIX domain-containing protein [Streptomyces sp. NPDC002491]
MLESLVVSGVVAFLGWIAAIIWRNRGQIALLLASARPFSEVRVSVAVLLQVQDDDGYVLAHSPLRPNSCGPFGGAVKFLPSAIPQLRAAKFREEVRSHSRMRHDLRGFLPMTALPRFARWLSRQEDRETAREALRRELTEELGEAGHPELATGIATVDFRWVRKVVDGPKKAPGHPYRQIRFFEVFELDLTIAAARTLHDALVTLARDPAEALIICAGREDIVHGRIGALYVAPQSAFLIGNQRLHADLPAPR